MICVTFVVLSILLLFASMAIFKDILSPSCVVCAVFAFAGICAIYNANKWRFQLSLDTFAVLSAGLTTFFIASVLVWYFTEKKRMRYKKSVKKMGEAISGSIPVSSTAVLSVVIVFFLLSAIYTYYVVRLSGGGSLSNIADSFRRGSTEGAINLPFVARLSWTLLRGLSIVVVYVLISNLVSRQVRASHAAALLLCAICYGALGLMSGERTSVLRLIAIAVLVYGVIWKRNNPSRSNCNVKTVVIVILALVVILYGFSAIRYFVGRTMSSSPLDYITYYAGTPIYNINQAISLGIQPTGDGSLTFLGFFNNFARLFGDEMASVHREYVINTAANLSMGNVYTFMYDYIHDYGILGLVLLTSIFSLVVNSLYSEAVYRLPRSHWSCTLYVFVGTPVFFAGFTEQFFSTYIAVSTIEIIVAIYFGFRMLGLKHEDKNRALSLGDRARGLN